MKKGYLICYFLCAPFVLCSQEIKSVLAHLQNGDTLHVEWVHQQYLLEAKKFIKQEYPLFPDQLSEGEGEMHTSFKIMLTKDNQFKIWVDYISTIHYPKRIVTNNPFEGIPDSALVFPIIEDTRYYFNEYDSLPNFYKTINKTPLIFDFDKGIINKNWFKDGKNDLKQTSLYFTPHDLSAFLHGLLEEQWINNPIYQKNSYYSSTISEHQHFFRPIITPQKTIIQGKIKFPTTDRFIFGYSEAPLTRSYEESKIQFDSTGQFKLEIALSKPNRISFSYGFSPFALYIEPGDSLSVEIDGNAIYRRMKFSGDNAAANQVLLDFYHRIRGDTVVLITPQPNIRNKTQAEYLARIQQKEKKELTFLAEQKGNIPPSFHSFLERTIRFDNAKSLWYNGVYLYEMRDAKITQKYAFYCQELGKLIFRLPNHIGARHGIVHYMRFQEMLLKGRFTRQQLPVRSYELFDLSRHLLSPESSFKYGESLLSIDYEWSEGTTVNKQFYQKMKTACLLPVEQKKLSNFLLPKPAIKTDFNRYTLNVLPFGEKAPHWQYPIYSGKDTLALSDFAGAYLLIHIGLEKNLAFAQEDIKEIISNSKGERQLKVVHLVANQTDSIKESTKEIIYLSYKEMEALRKDYMISNNANNYFAVDADGLVMANPFTLGTFNQLSYFIDFMKQPSFSWSIEMTPESWRSLGILSLILLTIAAIYTQRKRTLAKREQQKRQLVELELKGIRAQMNPHFLFNALSSIQNLIRKKEDIAADRYLTQFAGLVRKILRNSEQEFITLEEEIAAIKQYCSLEALRTPFDYEINIADDIDGFNTYIPGMLLQPLIENAILHGLMPQKGAKNLWINIQRHPQGLACEIIDNGIGIHQAKKQQQRHKAHQKSFGMALIRQRIQLLVGEEGTDFLKIQDRSELNPPATGTIVNLIIPIEK